MHCTIRSADRTIYDGEVTRIVARSPYGEFAVMDNHAPLLAVLPPGVIRYQISSGAEESIVCNGGTFELAENQAALLVEQPYRLDEIDTAAIRAQLATIQESGSDGTAPSGDRVYLELLLRTKESHG